MQGLSLCSGIGGIELGLASVLPEYRTVCYVEGEAYAAAVLAARMEEGRLHSAPIWSDLRTFDGSVWLGKVDIVTAGYPCQPFSLAGKRKGADDPRHLWPHVARIIAECKPACVFLENVPGHVTLGLYDVYVALSQLGYEVEAGYFSAQEVGAPHIRNRLFILATHPDCTDVWKPWGTQPKRLGADVADADGQGRLQQAWTISPQRDGTGNGSQVYDTYCDHDPPLASISQRPHAEFTRADWWATEPDVGRVAYGVSFEMDCIIDAQKYYSQAEPTRNAVVRDILRAVWEYKELAASSPDIYVRALHRCMPEVPRRNPHGRWLLGTWFAQDQGLRDMWEVFYSTPFDKTQNMQQSLLKRIRATQCPQTVARVDRLRALGNAVVPQCAAYAFETLMERLTA